MLNGLNIRSMNAGDLTFAAECTAAEGWVSENRTTLAGFFFYNPNGCMVAELDEKPVGICIATFYDNSGFIGELIVRQEARGRGIGGALLNRATDYLKRRGAQTIYLDGVVKAVALYERNGFRKICRSLRFSGKMVGKSYPQVRPMQAKDLPVVSELDRRHFGANRSFFLARRLNIYPDLSKVLVERSQVVGYILGRRGEGWMSAGPWVVESGVECPQRLLESLAVIAGDQVFSIGILESNLRAVEIVRSYGFTERADSPWRMAMGPDGNLGASPQCFAVGSAAKG